MHRHKILIADNDPATRRFIKANLDARDFDACTANDGVEAIQAIEKQSPGLLILDISLPIINGLEFCRHLREESPIPIIMLSSYSEEEYKVRSLDCGADDYLVKPFSVEELIARIKAIFRRTEASGNFPTKTLFSSGEMQISFSDRRVTVAGDEIRLTPTEFALLQELALNSNRVISHSLLLQKVWGPQYGQEKEYLRVFVGRLRKKLNLKPEEPGYIATVPWVGYKLVTNAANGGPAYSAVSQLQSLAERLNVAGGILVGTGAQLHS